MKNTRLFIISLLTVLLFGLSANAATWTVTKFQNSNDNVCDADCSLREAVFNADSGDTVVFNSNLVGQTFTLGGSEIVITKRITIDGNLDGVNVAFISGEMTSRIFNLLAGSGLTLKNAILVQGNGKPDVNFQGISNGGAIFTTNASLILDRVALRGNTARYSGAIRLLDGTHHFTNCSFTSNTAENNTAMGILSATLYMSNTTVSGNQNFVVNNNDFGGGAIQLQVGILIIRNSTITNNSGKTGGGISYAPGGGGSSLLDIGNTIVAGNTATEQGQDIRAFNLPITSRGGNLIGNLDTVPAGTFTAQNDATGINPLLGPINASLGGHPVLYHPLQAGSPALNTGLNANAVDPLTNQPLTTDTRGTGFPRTIGGTVDKGAFEDQTNGFSLIVTKNSNSNDFVCDSDCSLREAVYQASVHAGTDTITFAPNVFGTLALGGSEILIQNQSVNIAGYTKASTLTVSGGNTNRIFKLENATVSISGLTLADGDTGENGLGSAVYGDSSNLKLDRITITRNKAAAYPALYLSDGSTQRITNSTISGNAGKLAIGIGIDNTSLFMANTTVSGNYDYDGGNGNGSIYCLNSALTVRNSTIAYNSVPSGGSAGIDLLNSALNIGNSIVAQNQAGAYDDIELITGSIVSVGGNLIGDTNGFPAGTFSQTNDQTGIDPMLGILQDNGGNVSTFALLPNSPAINTGINSNAVDPFDSSVLMYDARGSGFARIGNLTADKGAFELQSLILPTPTPTPTATPTPTPIPTPSPSPTPLVCTPSTTVAEGDLFPGGIVSFGVVSGSGTVTVDHVNVGTGLQSLTVLGNPTNAVVNIPAFTIGTFNPVVVTFTPIDPNQPVNFRLRAASTFHSANIRARCGILPNKAEY